MRNIKKLKGFTLLILATASLMTSLSLGLTSCSKQDLQSIFQRIKNAIQAIGALPGKSIGQGDNVFHNTTNINKIRFVLANAFGINVDKFNSSIQTLNLIPIEDDNKEIHSWIVSILLKDELNIQWPNELIENHQNSAKPNNQNSYYFATKKFLSFKVDTKFEKIVVNISNLQNDKDFITKSVNKLNGIELHNNTDYPNHLNKNGLEQLVYAMSTTSNSFIPSSINVDSSIVEYTPVINFLNFSNEVQENQSTITDSKYIYDLVLKPTKNYVFVNANNQIINQVTFDNIQYNQFEIILSDSDKTTMYKSIVSATDSIRQFSIEQLNEMITYITGYIKNDEQTKLDKNLLSYFKNVSYELKTISSKTNTKSQEKELIIQFNFDDNVNFKGFSDFKPSKINEPEFTLQTNKYKHNVIQTSGLSIKLIENQSKFFKVG